MLFRSGRRRSPAGAGTPADARAPGESPHRFAVVVRLRAPLPANAQACRRNGGGHHRRVRPLHDAVHLGHAQAAHRPLYWILLPALLTLPLIAGGAVLIGLVSRRRHPGPDAAGSDRPSRPARAAGTDRMWRAALLALLVSYAVLVLMAAWFPVLPSYQRSSMAPAPNPLADYYVTIAIVATAVLPTRGRFAYVVALAPPLLATYPEVEIGRASCRERV